MYEKLLKATHKASDLNIPSIFVETNSFWYREDKTTGEEELKKTGLSGIIISVHPVLYLTVDDDFAALYDLARDYGYRRVETRY